MRNCTLYTTHSMDTTRLLELATLAIDVGDDDLAISTLTILPAQAPDYPGALWQIARYYGRKGAYAEAAAQFTRAVQPKGIFP